jgi:acetylornithine deacetylase/succinyl-diaminopimelate desuccinylase-like protein
VKGRAAHAATPGRGVNAIVLASHLVERLAAHKFQAEHDLLGRPTLTVSLVHGGVRHNIVPPACTIEFDRRIVPGERPAAVRREIAWILSETRRAHPRLRATIAFGLHAPPSEIPPDTEVVRLADAALRDLEDAGPARRAARTTDARTHRRRRDPR